MTTYYRLDDRNLSLAERWRFSRTLIVFLVFLVKGRLLRRRMTRGTTVARIDHVEKVPPDAVPPAVQDALRPRAAEIDGAGFALVLVEKAPSEVPGTGYSRVSLSAEGTVAAFLIYAGNGAIVEVVVSLATRLADGHLVVTTDAPHRFDVLPGHGVTFLPPRTPLAGLLKAHESVRAASGSPPVPLSPEDVEHLVVSLNHERIDEWLRQGILEPLDGPPAVPPAPLLPAPPASPRSTPNLALPLFALLALLSLGLRLLPGASSWTWFVFWLGLAGAVLNLPAGKRKRA